MTIAQEGPRSVAGTTPVEYHWERETTKMSTAVIFTSRPVFTDRVRMRNILKCWPRSLLYASSP